MTGRGLRIVVGRRLCQTLNDQLRAVLWDTQNRCTAVGSKGQAEGEQQRAVRSARRVLFLHVYP